MPDVSLATIIRKPYFSVIYFFALGALTSFILVSDLSLTSLMQILAILTFLLIILFKFTPKLSNETKKLLFPIWLTPAVLFINLLTFSTGGLASPFLIATHFFSIALSFILSPQIAVSFIASSIAQVIINLAVDKSALAFLIQTPVASALYLLAYIALIPFVYILSKEYKIKEEWIQVLEKQIATSQSQEEELLKNITDAVFALDNKFNLVYLNKAASQFSQYGKEILGKNFFGLFSFKDKDGRTLESYSLPFAQTISSKIQSYLENIQIQTGWKEYVRVDVKILPAISPEGPLGIILIVKDRSQKEQGQIKKESTALLALARFLTLLSSQKQMLGNLVAGNKMSRLADELNTQNQELEHLAYDFSYSLRLESGEIGSLSSLLDLGNLLQEVLEEEKPQAQKLAIILAPKSKTQTPFIQPKLNLRIPLAKRVFPEVFTLGTIPWIKDSLKRILELLFALSQKKTKLEFAVERIEDLAQIQIFTQINNIPPELASELFEKFHGKLKDHPALSQTTGLEGFIAKSLIQRMGGNLFFEADPKTSNLVLKITFGLKENSLVQSSVTAQS